jgi:hypothetical protein
VAAAEGRGQQTRRPTILYQLGCGMGCVVLSGTRARPAHAPAGRRLGSWMRRRVRAASTSARERGGLPHLLARGRGDP